MHLDDGFDLVNLLFWLVIGIISTAYFYGAIMKNTMYYQMPDKSALTAVADNSPDPYEWYVRDYILMLMVADEYCPDPKSVDLKIGNTNQDTRVVFDSDYLTNMEGYLQQYYIKYLSNRVDQPITGYDYYYENGGEKGRWRFTTQ